MLMGQRSESAPISSGWLDSKRQRTDASTDYQPPLEQTQQESQRMDEATQFEIDAGTTAPMIQEPEETQEIPVPMTQVGEPIFGGRDDRGFAPDPRAGEESPEVVEIVESPP
eukprot:4944201-Pyramimonas_sp.AAC.1